MPNSTLHKQTQYLSNIHLLHTKSFSIFLKVAALNHYQECQVSISISQLMAQNNPLVVITFGDSLSLQFF
jgi:hypothetical protein